MEGKRRDCMVTHSMVKLLLTKPVKDSRSVSINAGTTLTNKNIELAVTLSPDTLAGMNTVTRGHKPVIVMFHFDDCRVCSPPSLVSYRRSDRRQVHLDFPDQRQYRQ